MSKNALFLAIVIAVIASACGSNAVYDASIDIPQKGWSADSVATFNVTISDTTSVHNIFINLRNTTNYPNSNLFLFIQTHSPSGAMLRDTLECFLANTKGEWQAKVLVRFATTKFCTNGISVSPNMENFPLAYSRE